MAKIRKAHNYTKYILAILISGLFTLFGKPGPGWAEEAKTDQNAHVFQQKMSAAPNKRVEAYDYAPGTVEVYDYAKGNDLGNSLSGYFKTKAYEDMIIGIKQRMEKGEAVEPAELAIVMQKAADYEIAALKVQLGIIQKMMQENGNKQ